MTQHADDVPGTTYGWSGTSAVPPAELVRENKPLPTMDGEYWQPLEVFNLRARYPNQCWEPWLSEVCSLPAGHHGYHGWSTKLGARHNDGDACAST